MYKHSKFSSIGQFRNVIHDINHAATYVGKDAEGNPIYDELKEKPVLKFTGTIKLHGSNAGVVQVSPSNEIYFQSRERIITPTSDNAGFAFFAENNRNHWERMFEQLRNDYNVPENVSIGIFGEWAGKSINNNVAINNIEKSFFIFAIKIIDFSNEEANFFLSKDIVRNFNSTTNKIYNIYDYPTFEIEIDFNNPLLKQNELIELTTKVADECPVAKEFGHSGIGEGIVFTTYWNDVQYVFKSKDKRHSKSSKVHTLKVVDENKLSKVQDVAVKVTPIWRLEQMLTDSCDLNNGGKVDRKNLGNYIKAVISDVLKEESDLLFENNLEIKDVQSKIGDIARNYFFQMEKESI